MRKIKIWTDGSARTQSPRHGGCGAYILEDTEESYISRGFSPTTTSRMEIMALLLALKAVRGDTACDVQVYSDSQYVVNAIKEGWIYRWQRRMWMGVKNSDLWKELIQVISERPYMLLTIDWVKGHHKSLENDIVFGNHIADSLSSYKNFEEYERDLGYEVGQIQTSDRG